VSLPSGLKISSEHSHDPDAVIVPPLLPV
jgi:hypothetical protein